MADGNLVRLGGIFGLLSVVAMIPAYLVGSPDTPGSPEEAGSYFEAGLGTFVFSNGVLPLFHIFFFILFLGVLYGLLRGAEEGDGGAGGVRGALPGRGPGRGDLVRHARGGRLYGGDPLPGSPPALWGLRTGRRVCAGVFDARLLAVPLLPDRGVGYGTSHLPGGVGNRCTAEMVSPGSLRDRTADALARPVGLVAALVGLLWIAAGSVLMLTGGIGVATGGSRRRTVHR